MANPPRIIINIPGKPPGKAGRPRTFRPSNPQPVPEYRIIAHWLFALTLLMIYFCGTFPFDFSLGFAGFFSEIHDRFDFTTNQLFTISESWEKFVFYMPLGFALGAMLSVWPAKRSQNRAQLIALRCAVAIAASAAIATSVEIIQVFLSRDPSLADIIAKTAGSVLGFGIFAVIGDRVMSLLARALVAVQKINDPRIFAAFAAVWLVLAGIAPIAARNIGRLESWQPSYSMLVGNETDGIRHWDGTVSDLWLSASGLDDDGIDSILGAKDPGAQLGDSLVSAFHLTGIGPYRDSTGETADLVWTPNFNTGAVPGTTQPADLTGVMAVGRVGVPISEGWWLSTPPGGAAKAVTRIARANAFTLVMDLAMHDLDHGDGWPRVFSISKNGVTLNLQLLQDRENLQLRIRSSASGNAGFDPEFYVPNIFTDTLPHRLVVTYDRGGLRVQSSNSGERYFLRYLPDAWLVWRIFPSAYWHYTLGTEGQAVAVCLYRVAALLPIGMLIGAIIRLLRQRARTQSIPLIFFAGIFGSAVALEASLHFGAGTPLWISPMIAGLFAGLGGVWLVLRDLPVRQRWV